MRTKLSLNPWKAFRPGAGAKGSPRPSVVCAGAEASLRPSEVSLFQRPLRRVEDVEADLGCTMAGICPLCPADMATAELQWPSEALATPELQRCYGALAISNTPPAPQALPQNPGLERAKTAWAEPQRAWETVLWQTKTQEYSLQPLRQLAGKPPLQTSQQRPWETPPRRLKSKKPLYASDSCGEKKMTALSLGEEEDALNRNQGDLSLDMELPTWNHYKPTVAQTDLQNGAASSPLPGTGSEEIHRTAARPRTSRCKLQHLAATRRRWARQRKLRRRQKKGSVFLAITALGRLTLHLLQQKWRGHNLQILRKAPLSFPDLVLNPQNHGSILYSVCEVQTWQKHSVKVCVAEDPRTQTSREHDGIYVCKLIREDNSTFKQSINITCIPNFQINVNPVMISVTCGTENSTPVALSCSVNNDNTVRLLNKNATVQERPYITYHYDVPVNCGSTTEIFTCESLTSPKYAKNITLKLTQIRDIKCKNETFGDGPEGFEAVVGCKKGKVGEITAVCQSDGKYGRIQDNCILEVINNLLDKSKVSLILSQI
ncbi:hypothetical protein ATANTOWER_012185 [Ataeniobius toweri]|uniref:Uncharacterized protein n=1 Tax=Ataeniobius toweri TaxID=208326 RepID=A0ABU7CI63_9TELE|nr:hypothetical protein [Ataeniobius toweri]